MELHIINHSLYDSVDHKFRTVVSCLEYRLYQQFQKPYIPALSEKISELLAKLFLLRKFKLNLRPISASRSIIRLSVIVNMPKAET